jgi:hypothetical protein
MSQDRGASRLPGERRRFDRCKIEDSRLSFLFGISGGTHAQRLPKSLMVFGSRSVPNEHWQWLLAVPLSSLKPPNQGTVAFGVSLVDPTTHQAFLDNQWRDKSQGARLLVLRFGGRTWILEAHCYDSI